MQDESRSINRVQFIRQLVEWFAREQRALPWRQDENARDAYRVLVSEIMLQQTTVAAVVPFYNRFLARFPTVQSLAEAPLESVLKLWAGLGYYSRARHLHQAAQLIVKAHNGKFPQDFDDVLALPGVGRYTAGAVTSIAHDTPAPIVDANVARVFARLFCVEGDIKRTPAQRFFWEKAEEMVRECAAIGERPSQLNPALMELGALICIPLEPRCHLCPVQSHCCAFESGRQQELPQSTPRAAPTPMHDICIFVARPAVDGETEILLRQRAHDEKIWWRGMWELPRTTVLSGETPELAFGRLYEEIGVRGEVGRVLTSITHGVTRYRITLECYDATVEETEAFQGRWMSLRETETLALPSPMRKLLRWLQQHHIDERQLKLL